MGQWVRKMQSAGRVRVEMGVRSGWDVLREREVHRYDVCRCVCVQD